MNYETLSMQLVRSLRGKRSQVALSRRMKFQSNVLYTWEAGRRWPTAPALFQLATKVGVDVPQAIARFLGGLPESLVGRDFTDAESVAGLLEHLREGTTLVEIARRIGVNRVSVTRWFKGDAQPPLPAFLQLIDATSLRLLDFLSVLVSPESLPEARDAWRVLEAQRTVAYRLPWSHAVMRVLELDAYRALAGHEPGFIASRLGISKQDEQQCLAALASSKLIAMRRGRWVVRQVLTVDTRRTPGAGQHLKRHWAQVGLERLPALEPNEEDLFSYNLFTVSEKDWTRLRDLHIAYYQELRRVIEASTPAERVALVNLQLMRLDEPAVAVAEPAAAPAMPRPPTAR